MNLAGPTLWLAEAGLDPGGVILGLLCLVAVAFTALMTSRGTRQSRRPPGTPLYRRSPRYGRRIDNGTDWGEPDLGSSHDSGSSGCGGGGGGD